ncbi:MULTISPECIES: alpha/beta fold hydrolase [unclassified Burkholderia]|uniref:alpha/beta fold hydrolase n=1 Tax=unclassified Burkholderia TaxID=2613784 RepID=UPI0021AB54BB|nr:MULTISPECIES: alpha/beta fold hydrolase [unclassified Burkholderia]
MAAAAAMFRLGSEFTARNLRFAAEEEKLHCEPHPALASPNRALLELRTMTFRDYSVAPAHGLPTIVEAPYAGHRAMIADYQPGQSLMQTLREHGVTNVYLTDWRSATEDMRDLEIDQYLAELNVCVDELGGRVNLVGLCQGGWMSAMYAARFPHKVASLVLAGAPIDTDAGDGPIKRMAHACPTSFYEELVTMGGGLMRGRFMLRGWKNMHPDQHYLAEHVDLYEHLDDADYLRKREAFANWYESPIDLPGRWYLQAIVQIFKENRLAKGTFVALGRTLDLKAITCPVYLLAGAADDITTQEQVFAAQDLVGTPASQVTRQLVPGGHIGLFMGSRTLKDVWPGIARWIAAKR